MLKSDCVFSTASPPRLSFIFRLEQQFAPSAGCAAPKSSGDGDRWQTCEYLNVYHGVPSEAHALMDLNYMRLKLRAAAAAAADAAAASSTSTWALGTGSGQRTADSGQWTRDSVQ